jgi:hypothetical protein
MAEHCTTVRRSKTIDSNFRIPSADNNKGSFIILVPTWSGSPEAGPLQAFLTSVETTSELGSWTDLDKVRIASLKLTETARAFYDATLEIQDRELKWSKFKSLLQ